MITISACTSSDCDSLAGLWNAKALDVNSCWYQASIMGTSDINTLMASGFEFAIAKSGDAPVGFGFWNGPVESFKLVALAADNDEVYYRLMAAYCAAGLALGAASGWAEIGAATTTEKNRMDALGVIIYTPIGFAPLAPGQDISERHPVLLKAECALDLLAAKLVEVLGGTA